MVLIEKLSDQIEEELNDAEKYIRCALKHKEDHPSLAQTSARLSSEEMNHVGLLHDQVVILINEYRKEHGDPPEKMQDRYDYLHKRHIDHANEIKIMQTVFKGA